MSGSKLSSRTVSTKQSHNSKNGAKPSIHRKTSAEEIANVTIRLSDLGIIKRSPSESDLLIQSERVQYVIENTIEKLQLAVCLPRLLRHKACMLHRFMQPQEVEFIETVCAKYSDLREATSSRFKKSSLSAMLSTTIDKISLHESKRKFGEKFVSARDQDHLVDPYMAQVMEMLWNHKALREKVLAEFHLIAENPSTILINCMTKLKEVAQHRLSLTAYDERAREQRLRKAWKANTLIEDKIHKTHEQLIKQREDLGQQLDIKNGIILDYQSKIENLLVTFRDDVRHKISESEREMAEETEASEIRQVDLSAEAKAVTQQYESLLSQHLAFEKGLRAKRFKVETQLSSWLTKYDADIGERQAEFEEITKGYEEEKAEMQALQEKFDEQEEEYVVLMAEKQEEEQRIWEDRAYVFLTNRAARKIQRYWRAYRQRKIDKKKAKKAKAKEKKEKSAEGGEGGEGGEAPSAGKGKKGSKDKGKGKGKGKDKGKKDEEPSGFRGPDFDAALDKKFGGDLLGDLKGEEFSKKEVVVVLSAERAGVTDVTMG